MKIGSNTLLILIMLIPSLKRNGDHFMNNISIISIASYNTQAKKDT